MHKDDLPIRQPCHADWESMRPEGDTRRFCEQCEKPVHDLNAMSEPEVHALLQARRPGERVCLRYTTDRAGHLSLRAPRRAAAALLTGAALAAPACGTAEASGVSAEPSEPSMLEQAAEALYHWIFDDQVGCTLTETLEYEAPEVLMGDVMPVIVEEAPPKPSEELEPPGRGLTAEELESLQALGGYIGDDPEPAPKVEAPPAPEPLDPVIREQLFQMVYIEAD
ncbi:MAG: hypothetical protein H6741_11875 [Alphaproteobacteria bacterium]|nr:hypothetical protein [Alphaproteobacteria bacterium]MCB9793410.1 hypothetical protein [Alphaproteobacteria bacterium]